MNTEEILAKSKKFKTDADSLLNQSQLLELLGFYGEVKSIGAYNFDIMLSGDIDLHVYGNFKRENVVVALNKLIDQKFFQAYKIDDYMSFKNSDLPEGYYIGLRVPVAGYKNRWKIDIWFLSEDNQSGKKYYELLSEKLNNDNKIAILKFKNYKNENKLDFPSAFIYEAVLNENITEIGEFETYLKTNANFNKQN